VGPWSRHRGRVRPERQPHGQALSTVVTRVINHVRRLVPNINCSDKFHHLRNAPDPASVLTVPFRTSIARTSSITSGTLSSLTCVIRFSCTPDQWLGSRPER
jgi:hypothetical protein